MDFEVIRDFLTCHICLEIAQDAMLCVNCSNMMCEGCVKQLVSGECPFCRKINSSYESCMLARRMIFGMACVCPNQCGFQTTILKLQSHIIECPKKIYTCSYAANGGVSCKYQGKLTDFLDHIVDEHETNLISRFDNQSATKGQNGTQYHIAELSNMSISDFDSKTINNKDNDTDIDLDRDRNAGFDRINTRINAQSRQAKLGQTGKYYCGGTLESRCVCCNGICGPDFGCNCKACMILDIKARMLPEGYLVNKKGFIARKGATGQFYCGRKCMVKDLQCNGYCGPTNGPACNSCKTLNQQALTIYKEIK